MVFFDKKKDGRWDLDNPIIKVLEDDSPNTSEKTNQRENEENLDPISVMKFVDGQIWCAICDRIFVISPNSLDVQVNFEDLFFLSKKEMFLLSFSIHFLLMNIIVIYRKSPQVLAQCIMFGLHLKIPMKFVCIIRIITFVYLNLVSNH